MTWRPLIPFPVTCLMNEVESFPSQSLRYECEFFEMLSCWNGINHVAISAHQASMRLWLALGHQKEQWQSYSLALLFASSVLQGPSLPYTWESDFKITLTTNGCKQLCPTSLRGAGSCQSAAGEEWMSQKGSFVSCCAHLRPTRRWTPGKCCSGYNLELLGMVFKEEMNP